MRPFRGLLLDADGTLVDSSAQTEVAWSAWARQHGLDVEEVVRACHGVPARQTVARFLPESDVAAEVAAVGQLELETGGEVGAFDGAAELLALRAPDGVAVVTSATPDLLAERFGGAGLTLPRAVITAADVERGKPDPEPYLRGAAAIGLEPADCLVVEDAPAGIVAAVAAGCQVAAVAQTHAPDELGAADEVFADVRALLARVG